MHFPQKYINFIHQEFSETAIKRMDCPFVINFGFVCGGPV